MHDLFDTTWHDAGRDQRMLPSGPALTIVPLAATRRCWIVTTGDAPHLPHRRRASALALALPALDDGFDALGAERPVRGGVLVRERSPVRPHRVHLAWYATTDVCWTQDDAIAEVTQRLLASLPQRHGPSGAGDDDPF